MCLLLPVPETGTMTASNLIHYFSSHPAAFGLHNFCHLIRSLRILNPANKRNDIGAAGHVT